MRLALAAASITAAAALVLGGAAPALAAPGGPGTPTSGTPAPIAITDVAASGTAPADAAVLPIALGGLGLAVLAASGGYVVGRTRRDQDEHRRDGETGAGRQDTEQDGALTFPPPYCLWW